MFWRCLSDTAFSDAKQLLAGCREQLGKKDTEFDSELSHSFQTAKLNLKKYCCFTGGKMFLFEKIDKNVQFSFLFLGNS